jgi:NADPH-dependent 2,4-dienoyl-CoA reductase/sulfur reductase-like enzyme/rhodanese-related sulfurtransferase
MSWIEREVDGARIERRSVNVAVKKVVIIGGVAGGASCAARLRRLDEKAEIVLLEKDDYVSFANCGLPYYIGGAIKKRDNLLVQTPASLNKRFNIDVRVKNEAIRIDRENHSVDVKDLNSGEIYQEKYDKLVLSPGAAPVVPNLPGASNERVFTLRSVFDVDRIKAFAEKPGIQDAVIIGAGFIGLEMADNLKALGLNVTVVEMADHVLPALDFEMSAIIHNHMLSREIAIHLKDGVKAIHHDNENSNKSSKVELSSGTMIDADLIIMSIGVRPVSALAVEAGLKIGETGGIYVDENLRTSDPDIYAVGDAIEVKNLVTGSPALIPLAGPANKQGRIAADNIDGRDEKYSGTMGTAIVKVFDMAAAITGINESAAKRFDIPFKASVCHPASHANYYPGASVLSIKTLFDPDNGRVLGAQVVGSENVDKTIDAFAIAIKTGMTVYDLEELELSYAPPFSGAKNPVNMAGFLSSNILKGDVDVISWEEFNEQNGGDSILLDVRTPRELSVIGAIEGAVNIPVDELRSRFNELPRDKTIDITCQVGLRAYIAARILKQHGFKINDVSGGYYSYQHAASVKRQIDHQ